MRTATEMISYDSVKCAIADDPHNIFILATQGTATKNCLILLKTLWN